MPRTPVYTAEQADQIVRAAGYKPKTGFSGFANSPWDAECAQCGAPRKISVSKVLYGLRCRHVYGSVDRLPIAEITEKYAKMASLRALAKEYGVSYASMHRRLTDAGVTLRQRGGDTRSKESRKRRRANKLR